MDLHKYPLDTQHCPLMIGSCKFYTVAKHKAGEFLTQLFYLGLMKFYKIWKTYS